MNTQELAEKLVQYPELKKRVEELILIVENRDREPQLADE